MKVSDLRVQMNLEKIKKKKPKLRWYEVGVPVKETWVFRVLAKNKKDAWDKIQRNEDDSIEQVCSLGGGSKYVILDEGYENEE